MSRPVLACGLVLHQDADVHMPDPYGAWLAEVIDLGDAETGCDLTSGCGIHALRLASAGLRTVAIDVNQRAVALTQHNAVTNGLEHLLDVRHGDLYSALHANERFDRIVAWPPVMPTPIGAGSSDFWAMANNGGADGRAVLDRVIADAPRHLTRIGSVWTAHPWYLDLEETYRVAAAAGLAIRIRAAASFPMGPTSLARLDYLRSIGLTPRSVKSELIQDFLALQLSLGTCSDVAPTNTPAVGVTTWPRP